MGQICGCSTQLLSPRLYDEFIRPLDEEILALWPRGGMIHLCGAHAHHIPALEAMAPLRAVQMNHRAADDVAEYHRRLRDDQILYVNIYDKMPLERILEHTRGGDRTVIVVPPGEMRQTMEKWESLGPCNSDS
ncbi:MAG: hypothetical protein BWZ10_00829 [candidate division BRC1 bacterium ADurb.BinA364]|nr:MAG: hypothetical protein BWZ10_00829 [candidate division BRC1 bacterium ADurb.BinA364]